MKKILICVGFFLILSSQVSSGSDKFVLKIGYTQIISHLPLIVSYDDLRLKKIDFEIKMIPFSSFTSLEAGLRTGAIHAAAVPALIAFNIISDDYNCRACKIKIIGALHQGGSIIVSSIGGLDSFQGEIISVPGIDSTETILMKDLMSSKQYTFGIDYKVIGDSFSSVLNNLKTARVRAAFFPEPYGTMAVHNKIAAPVQIDSPLLNQTHYTVLAVNARVIADHSDSIQIWLQSLINACRILEKDIDECGGRQTAILQSSFFGFPRNLIIDSLKNRTGGIRFDGFIPKISDLKKLYHTASDLKLIMKSIDWNEVFDPDLMIKALQK